MKKNAVRKSGQGGSKPQVMVEDLTTDDAPMPGENVGTPLGPKKHVWMRPVKDEKTKVVTWTEYELRSYERSVEDLWHRLCEADVPLPFADVMKNLDAFGSCAVKMLYLLSHEPWQYRHLRADTPKFIEAIEQWGDECVPRSKTIDAVTLALLIHNQAHKQDATDPERTGDPAAQG